MSDLDKVLVFMMEKLSAANPQPSTNTKTKLDLTKHFGIFTNPRMLCKYNAIISK